VQKTQDEKYANYRLSNKGEGVTVRRRQKVEKTLKEGGEVHCEACGQALKDVKAWEQHFCRVLRIEGDLPEEYRTLS